MITAPEWISKELLENALKNHLDNENIAILGYASSPAIPVGENYTSSLFRTFITYRTGENGNKETISVIIKCLPENKMMLELVTDMKLFETEADIYTKALPIINNALGEGQSETVSAKCVYYMNEPNPIIIFDDLSALNFKMHPRQQGLDLQHCLLVVEKLAYFHASSLVLYETDTPPLKKYTEGIFIDNDFTTQWIMTGLTAVSDACLKWSGYEKYSSKLNTIKDTAIARTLQAKERKDFNVLIHGDAWINNFMFSYSSNGKLIDFRFVDFQLVVYTSPVIDLVYFWATSPNMEVKTQHFDTIFDHYYAKLSQTATKLQQKVPSKEELRNDFNSRAFYGLAAAVTVLPIVTASIRDEATLEDFVGNKDEGSFQHESFNNARYREHIEHLLPFFDQLGVFD